MTEIQLCFNQLTEKLRQRSYLMTPRRLAVIRLTAAGEEHPNAVNLFIAVKVQYPTMSLAIVYKTIDLLKDLNDVSHYEESKPYSHPHNICTDCRKIIDGYMEESMSNLIRGVEQNTEFKI